jgi:hypothetical protein
MRLLNETFYALGDKEKIFIFLVQNPLRQWHTKEAV